MVYPAQDFLFQQTLEQARRLYLAGQLDQAAATFSELLRMDLNYAPALQALGRIALQSNDGKTAVRHLSRANKLMPDVPSVLNDLSVALVAAGEVRRAADMFRRLLKLEPDNIEACRNFGLLLVTNEHYAEAVEVLEKYITLTPGQGYGHALLATAYFYTDRLEEAKRENALAVAIDPEDAGPYELLGLMQLQDGKPDAAAESFAAAVKRDPRLASAYGNMGQALASVGRFDEARAAFKKSLTLVPLALPFLNGLTDLGRFVENDDRLPFLETVLARASELSEANQIGLYMSLGKVADDLGQPEKAMGYWHKQNALYRKDLHYDEAAELGQMAEIARIFSAEFLAAHAGAGAPSERPVFVVGMPRSGTTLIEQILASHSNVYGAGERFEWNTMLRSDLFGTDFPAHVSDLTPDAWQRAGQDYLAAIARDNADAARVIDKMPSNFRYLGLIRLALPGAKMLYVHRDPADCALSCYSKKFPTGGYSYIYDLGELGRYMRACETLMAHWKTVLPEDCLLEVCYEDLVRDFDPQARRMVDFIGLDWEEACACFYETKRQVVTASQYAVRQPLSTRSIGRARPYHQMMAAFFAGYRGSDAD